MKINGLIAEYSTQIRHKKTAKTPKTSKKKSISKDTYISSNNSHKNKLKSIKEKIKSGFYNSNEVVDDISDKLAQIFDKD